jgi:hypothetical protein
MSKHLADRRSLTEGGRTRHFMRLARMRRDTWHRPHEKPGIGRMMHFLRIARGRSA